MVISLTGVEFQIDETVAKDCNHMNVLLSGHFVIQTFCNLDILLTGHFDFQKFCFPDIL